MKTRPRHLFITFAILTGAGLASGWDVIQKNTWSLGFYQAFDRGIRQSNLTVGLPEGHDRALLWLAMDAMAHNDPALAEGLLETVSIEGRPEMLILLGRSLAAQGDLKGAIRRWSQAGYYEGLLESARNAYDLGDLVIAAMAYRAAWEIDPTRLTAEYVEFLGAANGEDPQLLVEVLDALIDDQVDSENRLEWLRSLGEVLLDAQHLDQAERAFEAVLTEAPEDFDAHYNLGWIYHLRGDGLERARDALLRAIAIDPGHAQAYAAVAQFLIDAGQYLEADPWLVQAIERDPAARWYWFLRGRTAYQAGDLVLSRAVLEETIARFPDWGLAYSELALTLMDSDRPLEALVWIDKAILYMDSPNAWYFVRKAEIHRMIDQNEEALGAYQDAWEINPAGVTPIYVDFLRHQYENPELAVEVLQKTIGLETEPDRRLELQILLGDFLREEQQIGEAEQVYIAILESQPDNIPALIGLGWIYYLRGDGLEAARAVILEAIAIDPSDSRGHFAMGQILSRVGLFAEADAWLAQAIEREPEARWYWFERGRTAYLAGDLDRSLALFDATIDRFPEWAPPHAEKALALIELNHPVDALSSIEEALRYMAPPNPWYFVRAAQIYEILGEKEKALEAYLAALEIDPENGAALNGVQNLEQESPSNPEGGSPQ